MIWNLKSNKTQKEDEIIFDRIVDKCLNRSDIERLISPESDEYFLIDRVNEICVLLLHDRINISNHKYSIQKTMSLSFIEKLKKKVRIKIEEDRQALKKTLLNNEADLLKSIEDLI